MIRFFRALAWLRWRLFLNTLRKTRRRDSLERASRVFQVVAPVLFFLFLVPGALVLAILAVVGGWVLGTPGGQHGPVLITMRIFLAVACAVMLLAPLLRAVQGSTPNLSRFLLLPIPRGSFYLCEAMASFGDPWLAVQTPGILLLPVGILAAGRPGAAALALAAGVALLGMLTGLGALASSFAYLLFRNRRRAELISVVLMILLSVAGMLPGLLSISDSGKRHSAVRIRAEARTDRNRSADGKVGWSGEVLPVWALAFPPELYVRSLGLGADRRSPAGLIPLALLAAMAAGIHGAAWKIYGRLLDTPEIGAGPRRGEKSRLRWVRAPGLSPAASAVALVHVRMALRTVQGKIQFWMTPLIVLALGALWSRQPGAVLPASFPIPPGVLLAFAGVVLSCVTLEGVILNQFAVDRAGLTLQFLAPISDRDLVRGKAAGGAFLAGSRALLCFVAAAVVAPGRPILLWPGALLAGCAVYILLAPAGAILSMLLPKAADMNRIGQAGKPHPIASILGFLVILTAAGPAVALALVAVLLLKSAAAALALLTGWALLCALISIPLYRVAEKLLARRRENLALVAQGR